MKSFIEPSTTRRVANMPLLLRVNLLVWTAFSLITALSALHFGLSQLRNIVIALVAFAVSLIPMTVHRRLAYGPDRPLMRGITLYTCLSIAVCIVALCGAIYRIAFEHLPVFG